MKGERRILLSIVWFAAGVVLIVLGVAERVDAFWSGMGGGLAAVGAIQLLRRYRLHTDEAYREKVEIEISDERNRFLRGRAWAWAGYLFILISAIAVIALKVGGQELLSTAAAYGLCLMLVLYWGSYMVLKRKY